MIVSAFLEDFTETGAVIIGCSVALLLATKWVLSSEKNFPSFPKVPGALPVIGNFHQVGRTENLSNKLTEWADKYGKERGVFEMDLAGVRYLVACRDDTVLEIQRQRPFKIIRSKQLTRSANAMGAHGVFSAEGGVWKKDRRIFAPLLNHRHCQDYLSTIKIITSRLVKKWGNLTSDGSAVAVNNDFYGYMVDIIALASFGKDFNSLHQVDSVQAMDVASVLKTGMMRGLSPVAYWNIPVIGQYLDGGGWSRSRLLTYIEDIVKEYEKDEDESQKSTVLGKLVALTKSSSRLPRQRMVGNLLTMFFGATDSSASVLTTMAWLLATKKELQDKLTAEVVQFGNLENASMREVVDGMPRLKAFAYESYRVYGAFPLLFFEAAEQVELAGEKVSPQTQLILLIRYISTNEAAPASKGTPRDKEFPPSEFHPERWLIQETNGHLSVQTPDVSGGGYLPFGGDGPRKCPGADFALMVEMFAVASLLRRFEISLEPNHPPVGRELGMAEFPDKDIRVVLKAR